MKFIFNPKSIFVGLIILLVTSKLISLLNISFVFTGGDDLVFWQMAKDYGKGIFKEPFMYGQNYNYAIESFFSVPLLKLGVPYQYALPIATTALGIFPFVMFGYGFLKKEMFLASYLWLVIPIAMPIEYDIMTTITRGFINGLFFTGFLVFPLLSVHKSKSFILFGFCAALGYVTNPNSLVFSFPIGVYLFLQNFKNYKFYVLSLLSALPILILFYFSKQFYVDNPEYKVHSMWELTYSFQRIQETFTRFERAFKYLTPVFWFAN